MCFFFQSPYKYWKIAFNGVKVAYSTCLTIYYTLLPAILTLSLLTTTIVAPPSNASKWQMGFN